MSSYISNELRRLTAERAENKCEYCCLPQKARISKYEIEHILPRQHGGQTVLENLALACLRCNRRKGTNLGSFDVETGDFTLFFNPRTQVWTEYFRLLESGEIKPLTAEARVTIKILQINNDERIEERQELMKAEFYE